ncbi:MAG: class I SAM-dependent methyltransferase [Kibdelosporangium sp.]
MIVSDALRALVAGDSGRARDVLAEGVPDRPLLAAALAKYLGGDASESVYVQPAAFEAFILGGGNVPLYEAVSAALAQQYRSHEPASLVDIGCGNGMAIVPALASVPDFTPAVTLVEPSQALLETAAARLAEFPLRLAPGTARAFVDGLEGRFGLAESTFALHTMPHEERSAVLTALRPHVDRVVIAEFDVHDHGPDERVEFLADTYERGLAEYESDRDLVAQGFLMPVLAGQLLPGAVRSTWEQPAQAWVEQFESCGYRDVTAIPLCDYWSSPVFLLTAAA